MTTFQVDVVTPESIVWSGEATFLLTRTSDGDIGILANHEPTMAALGTGVAEIEHADGRTSIALHGGFLQVYRNQVTLLSDRAEVSEEGDARQRAHALRQADEAEDSSSPGSESNADSES